MKRLLFLIATLALALGCSAQQKPQHLKFMGIPITGTIATFQTKLIQKGFTLQKAYRGQSPDVKFYKGIFSGNKCQVLVYFNTKSRIVYKCRVAIECSSREIAEQEFNTFEPLIQNKYNNDKFMAVNFDDETDVYEMNLHIYSKIPEKDGGMPCIGGIGMFILDLDSSYPEKYDLIIDYIDAINNDKNLQSNINDL